MQVHIKIPVPKNARPPARADEFKLYLIIARSELKAFDRTEGKNVGRSRGSARQKPILPSTILHIEVPDEPALDIPVADEMVVPAWAWPLVRESVSAAAEKWVPHDRQYRTLRHNLKDRDSDIRRSSLAVLLRRIALAKYRQRKFKAIRPESADANFVERVAAVPRIAAR